MVACDIHISLNPPMTHAFHPTSALDQCKRNNKYCKIITNEIYRGRFHWFGDKSRLHNVKKTFLFASLEACFYHD